MDVGHRLDAERQARDVAARERAEWRLRRGDRRQPLFWALGACFMLAIVAVLLHGGADRAAFYRFITVIAASVAVATANECVRLRRRLNDMLVLLRDLQREHGVDR